jgi:L-erythro-3,5-diaminohexanoate dehydrogenase
MSVDRYGLSRVVGEPGVLPQRAQKLDPSLPLRAGELLIDVDALNVDAASFHQLRGEAGGDAQRVGEAVARIVQERGKLHNPVTGSGGMLIGRVREVAAGHPLAPPVAPGDRVATLVSLTLTPLQLSDVVSVDLAAERVNVRGHAILFASGLYALLPQDLPDALSLAVLDVCGAPGQVARLVRPGMRVLVLGAGKSGALCLAEARRRMQGQGQLLALDISPAALASLRALQLCDETLEANATQAVEVLGAVARATGGALCDLVINCASVGNTEMATVLATREGGTALFFSMATSFTAATLGAEGVGKDLTLLMGNGYVPGHAELALSLVRGHPELRKFFEGRYAAGIAKAP